MRKFLLSLLLFSVLQTIKANNITVSNVVRLSVNTVQHSSMIRFDVNWENSWRDASNWDAAWIFIKYRVTGASGAWSHATLNYVDGINDGHTAATGSVINTSNDGKGIFIYRNATGSGTNSFTNVQLRWNYGADGISDNTFVDISVSGIEMVYVSQGSYFVGDGSVTNVQGEFVDGASTNPLQITSENGLTLGGGTTGSLGNNNRSGMANNGIFSLPPNSIDDFDNTTPQTLPATFPKGFNAFYCMKYEITQAQYVDFLNKISAAQFVTRYDAANYSTSDGGHTVTRYNITGTYPNMTTTTPDLPNIYFEWYDAAAYADWTGLRPMTEMEFEKACRGTAAPVADEFAWGTNTVAGSVYTINALGTPSEGIASNYSTTTGNCWYTNTKNFDAIARVGIFAANGSNTGRITSGATFWGIMEMSGNIFERCVTVGRPEGRGFQGTHGDGTLTVDGNATNTDWPGYTAGNGVNTVFGCGYRGGSFNFPNPTIYNCRVSSRIMATAFYNSRYYDDGARLVRSAQ
ncbi:MAG: SUMF1/EgtB/PvdO family nonheme iron enzyme [Ferruginibacter sp.]